MIRFLAFILFFPCLLIGQTQPIESIEVELDPIVQDAFDLVSGRMNNVKAMLKGTFDSGVKIGYEMKIGKAFSLNPQFGIGGGIGAGVGGVTIDLTPQSTIGLRYFFLHKDKIEAGLQGNNLNGLYAELGTEFNLFGGILSGFNNFTYLKFGSQSRVFKHGLVDIGLRVSYSPDSQTLNINTGFDMGFARSKNYSLDDEFENNRCAIVNCYEENRSLIKIPANQLMDINFGQNYKFVKFRPTISLEHKISKVSLSMTHEFGAWLEAQEVLDSNIGTSTFFNSYYEMGIKWIVGKRRQMIKGETANNLSGAYIGPIGSIGLESGNPLNLKKYSGSYYSAGFRIGYQTRLLKNLYIDIKMGASYKEYFDLNDPDKYLNLLISDTATIDPSFDFLVGYAF